MLNLDGYRLVIVTIAILSAYASIVLADADVPALPEVTGVLGFVDNQGLSYFAVRLDYSDSAALAGVQWFSNDELLVYPNVLVGTGYPRSPGEVGEMFIVAEGISGPSSDWGSITFVEPIGASQGGVYVVFELPLGPEFVGEGEGGGPAFGYCDIGDGAQGWMSTDGETWMHLRQNHGFAVRPLLITIEPGMLVKSLNGEAVSDVPVLQPYLSAGPNPFNPRTDIHFGLPGAVGVKLDVYDIRGRRVIRLIDGRMNAGRHTVTWNGQDGNGRGVASGVYFVYMNFGQDILTKKIMLVR